MSGIASSAAEPPPSRSSQSDDDPIEHFVAEVVGKLRLLADTPEAKLTCDGLIEIIGARSHALAILIFSLLNLLPGPPGYSIVIGIAIMAFSVMMIFQQPMRLWAFVGHRRLPVGLLLKSLETLAHFVSFIARISSPRLVFLTGRAAIVFLGFFGFVMGACMLLPVPFTNTLPSMATAIACVAILNRDGLATILAVCIGIVGLAAIAVLFWLALEFGLFLGDAIHDAQT
ncbi:MAG TPA: exopolysaccharide biosynthesis protein [Devosiaceae bacterium]